MSREESRHSGRVERKRTVKAIEALGLKLGLSELKGCGPSIPWAEEIRETMIDRVLERESYFQELADAKRDEYANNPDMALIVSIYRIHADTISYEARRALIGLSHVDEATWFVSHLFLMYGPDYENTVDIQYLVLCLEEFGYLDRGIVFRR